jgi:hypothetical protein
MTSFPSQKPHSCKFCQRLVLDERDFEYEVRNYTHYDTLGETVVNSKYSGHERVLSRYQNGVILHERVSDKSPHADQISPGVLSLLELAKAKFKGRFQIDLGTYKKLWNFTLAELRQAATEGCELCAYLEGYAIKHRSTDDEMFPLLGASISTAEIFEFQVPRLDRLISPVATVQTKIHLTNQRFHCQLIYMTPAGTSYGAYLEYYRIY